MPPRIVLGSATAVVFWLLTSSVRAGEAPEPAAAPSAPAPAAPPGAGPVVARVSLPRALAWLSERKLALVAARHQVSASRAGELAASVWQNPYVSVNGRAFNHGAVQGGREEVSALVTQVLPVTGYLGLRKDAARAATSAEEARFVSVAWQLAGEVKRAYVGVLAAREQVRVLTAGLQDLERIDHVLDERGRAGATPAYDRLRVQIERDALRGRASAAETALLDARADLARAIGGATRPEDCDVEELAEPTPPPSTPEADLELTRRALQRRPEAEVARREATAARLRVDVARRRYVPEPQLGLGYVHWWDVPGATPTDGGAVLASLAVPVPLLDHGQGTVRQQVEEGRVAATRAAMLREEVSREVQQAAARLRARAATWANHRAATANAESVRRIAELTYKEGRATIVELLDAYAAYLRVAELGAELRGAALDAQVSLEQAIGP